ncbi:MAG: DUF2510 domain-containing protein [Actinomycetes bacterium]
MSDSRVAGAGSRWAERQRSVWTIPRMIILVVFFAIFALGIIVVDRFDGGLAVIGGLLLIFCGGAVLLALVNVQIFGLLSARDRQRVARDGWFPDPSGRHQLRFFDGTGWRADVWDSGVYGSDPEGVPPAPLPKGSGTTARPDGPAGG